MVQIADLYPTILDAFDIEIPTNIHSGSLLPYIIPDHGSVKNREYICYGVYGDAIYITDDEWMFVKRPESSGPLYWYTDSHFQVWDFGQNIDVEASEKMKGNHQNGKFPVEFMREELHDSVNRSEEKTRDRYQGKSKDDFNFTPCPDELYYLPTDYEQENKKHAIIFALWMSTVAGQLTILLSLPFLPTYLTIGIG